MKKKNKVRVPLYRVYIVGNTKVPMLPGHPLIRLPEGVDEFMANALQLVGELDQYYGAEGRKSLLRIILSVDEATLGHIFFAAYTTLLLKYQCEHHSWYVVDEDGKRYTI